MIDLFKFIIYKSSEDQHNEEYLKAYVCKQALYSIECILSMHYYVDDYLFTTYFTRFFYL